jgi:sugar phosphate isomerase/epimerase
MNQVVIHLTNRKNSPIVNNLGLDRIYSLSKIAEKYQIRIAIENVYDTDHLDKVFQAIPSKYVGLCYDSGHENYLSKNKNLLEKYSNRLMALHLSDNNGHKDNHRNLGEGTINWSTIRENIEKSIYSGPINLEVTNEFSKADRFLTAEEFMKKAHQQLELYFVKI